MNVATNKATVTGGRDATLRHIPGDAVLSVCMPPNPRAPVGWSWVALSDVAQMESGHTPSRRHPEYWGGDIPWIAVGDAGANHGATITDTREHTNALGIEKSSARLLPKGTVCLSRGGTVGYVVVLGRPMATSQGFANWICGNELSPEFLKYLFLREEQALHRFAIGATIQTIYYPDIKAFHVCIPSRPEQQRIVSILDEAFEGIDAAKANTDKNLVNARVLFESHLQSALVQRGEKWIDKLLGAFCAFENGDRGTNYPSKAARTHTGIPFINAGHLTDDGIDLESMNYISRERFDLLSNGKVRRGDILFCLRGSLGKFARVDKLDEGAIASSLVIVRPDETASNEFVEFYFRSSLCSTMISRFRNGAAQPNLSAHSLSKFVVPFPPRSEQDAIVNTLAQVRALTQRLESIYRQKLAALDAFQRSLLHQAFAGVL